MRRIHQKINFYVKDERTGMISSVLVPNDEGGYDEITDAEQLSEAILKQNATNLSKANISPPANGLFQLDIGNIGENEDIVEDILEGLYNRVIKLYSNMTDTIINTFIQCMKRPSTIPATEQIDLEITYKDFQELFKTTKEDTASSPSGLHIGHYKACAKSDYLSKIMAAFMCIPFKYGITIERWEQSLHCMLQKDPLPL